MSISLQTAGLSLHGSCLCLASLYCSSLAVLQWPIFDFAELGESPTARCIFRLDTNLMSRVLKGHTLDEIPYRASFGVWGSWVCFAINAIALIAQFYVALYPVGGPNLNVEGFFETYMAGPFLIVLYLIWKVYSWFKYPSHRPLWIRAKDIDIYTGMRQEQRDGISGAGVTEDQRRASIQEMRDEKKKKGAKDYIMAAVHTLF